ncbi:hypothetical protein HK097_011557, partial [Rhizophlyctis rosea]
MLLRSGQLKTGQNPSASSPTPPSDTNSLVPPKSPLIPYHQPKPSDFSARTVITGDPNLSIDQAGLPRSIARNSTFRKVVTKYNFENLGAAVANGHTPHTGAVINSNYDRMVLRYAQEDSMILKTGNKVVKVMPYSTIQLSLSVTSPYNAAFESTLYLLCIQFTHTITLWFNFNDDEMNLHIPQSYQTMAAIQELCIIPRQLGSPQKNGPGIIQDTLCRITTLTQRNTFLRKDMTMNMLRWIRDWDRSIPEPAILQPVPLWTGKQMMSLIIGSMKMEGKHFGHPDTEKTWMSSGDMRVIIQDGELNAGMLSKGTVRSAAGPEVAKADFKRTQLILNYWLFNNAFSIAKGDFEAHAALQGPNAGVLDPCLRGNNLVQQDHNLPPALVAEANALRSNLRRNYRARLGSDVGAPRFPPAALPTPVKKAPHPAAMQLIDRQEFITLRGLLFVHEPASKPLLHRLLVNVAENTKTCATLGHVKYPVVVLLSLLDGLPFLKKWALMEQLMQLLMMITKPLSAIGKKNEEEEKETKAVELELKPTLVPEQHVRAVDRDVAELVGVSVGRIRGKGKEWKRVQNVLKRVQDEVKRFDEDVRHVGFIEKIGLEVDKVFGEHIEGEAGPLARGSVTTRIEETTVGVAQRLEEVSRGLEMTGCASTFNTGIIAWVSNALEARPSELPYRFPISPPVKTGSPRSASSETSTTSQPSSHGTLSYVIQQLCILAGNSEIISHELMESAQRLGDAMMSDLDELVHMLTLANTAMEVQTMGSMRPLGKDLLLRSTPLMNNNQEKVQEHCMDLVGRLAVCGEFERAREWTRTCFELLSMLKSHKQGVHGSAVNTFRYIAKAMGPQDVLATLLNNLKVQERQNRVCATVAIAIVAEICSPFTVLPALMNQYRVTELYVQNRVLKRLSFLFEYIGQMGKNCSHAVAPLLEAALMDPDLVQGQTAGTTVEHMSLGVFGLTHNDALLHLFNLLYPAATVASSGDTNPAPTHVKNTSQKASCIFVQSTNGRILTFEIQLCSTILYLKHQISSKEGIRIQDQRLIYGGKQL